MRPCFSKHVKQAILSVIRIKVDRDINTGRACREATITLNEQHDNDNCFFIHSATVACFDILNQISTYCSHSGTMGPVQQNESDVSWKEKKKSPVERSIV